MSETTNLKLFKHDNVLTNTNLFDIDKSLNQNWDKIDGKVGNLDLKNNNMQQQINSLASGSPLVASSISEMTDTTRVYVNTTDGHWYYYNGTMWVDGGVYQASQIADSSILLKNFVSEVEDVFSPLVDLTNISDTLNYEDGYYSINGTIVPHSTIKHAQITVTPGEIYYIRAKTGGARAWILGNSSNPNIACASSSGGKIENLIYVPLDATFLVINDWGEIDYTGKSVFLYRMSDLYINKKIINTIENNISKLNQNAFDTRMFNNSTSILGKYYSRAYLNLRGLVTLNTNDEIKVEFDYYSEHEDNLVGIGITYGKTGGILDTNNVFLNKITKHCTCFMVMNNINDILIERADIGLLCNQLNSDEINYIYNIKITNITTNEVAYVTVDRKRIVDTTNPDNNTKSYLYFNPLIFKNKENIKSVVADSYLEKTNKTIILAGDSLTANNGGNYLSIQRKIAEELPDATIINNAVSGKTSYDLVNQLTNITGNGKEIDYSNCCAVLINIGWNDGSISGSISSIPQIENATDLENNPLKYMDVQLAINTGFYYNGELIDTEEKYWNLFHHNYYSNVGKCIEYIQWKNPKTQIFLYPPLYAYNAYEKTNNICKAMKELAEFYCINFIDVLKGLNINTKNSYHFTYDGTHGTTERNNMLGMYLAKQILNKILF